MQADKTTLNDLSIFSSEEEQSVFHHLDFARTFGGREWLKYYLKSSLATIKEIKDRQQMLQCILKVINEWPQNVTNGTVMVLQKFYESPVETIPNKSNIFSAL